MITGLYAGILGLWLAFLYMSVVRFRREYHVGLGDGDKEDLLRAIRIHGNFTETVPYILLLMLLIEMILSLGWLVHGFGLALLASRLLHYRGLNKSSGATPERLAAGIMTMTLVVAGAAILIYSAVSGGAVGSF